MKLGVVNSLNIVVILLCKQAVKARVFEYLDLLKDFPVHQTLLVLVQGECQAHHHDLLVPP